MAPAPAVVRLPPTNTLQPSTRRWDSAIPVPPILRPLVRAYLLGYASAVAPRLLTLLLKHATSLGKGVSTTGPEPISERLQRRHKDETFLESFQQILRGGLDPRRFPAFCAVLVGGSTLLEVCCSGFPYLPSPSLQGTNSFSRYPSSPHSTNWPGAYLKFHARGKLSFLLPPW